MTTPRPGLCFVCQLCGQTVLEPCDAPDVELRRRVEATQLHTFHRCQHDGGTGLCRLVGTASDHANAADMLAGAAVP